MGITLPIYLVQFDFLLSYASWIMTWSRKVTQILCLDQERPICIGTIIELHVHSISDGIGRILIGRSSKFKIWVTSEVTSGGVAPLACENKEKRNILSFSFHISINKY